MKKHLLLLSLAIVASFVDAAAEDIIQVKPFVTHSGVTEDDEACMEVQLVNDTYDNVATLSFDLQLPEGIHYLDYEMDEDRVPNKVVRRKTNFFFTVSHGYFKAGFDRFTVVPDIQTETDENGNTKKVLYPLNGKSGTFLYLYFTVDADMKPGIYPIRVLASKEGTVIGKSSTEGIYPVTSSSYVIVKAKDSAPSPLETGTDLDLSGMTGYVPSFVTDSLNAALAKNGSLRSLDLGGATEFGAALRVPENVVWRTAVDGGLKRAFDAGKKATVCLPFALPADKAAELGKFYQFGGLKDGTTDVVTMTEVTDGLTANTPYIFEPLADVGGLSFGGDSTCTVTTAGSAGDEFAFLGTYDLKQWGEGDAELGTVYGFAGKDTTLADGTRFEKGQFVKFAAGAYAQPFRAYLKYSGGLADAGMASAKGGAVRLPDVINIEWVKADGTTTGIGSVGGAAEALHQADGWFTIDGRKLAGKPARRGVYIHGGKKRVITD